MMVSTTLQCLAVLRFSWENSNQSCSSVDIDFFERPMLFSSHWFYEIYIYIYILRVVYLTVVHHLVIPHKNLIVNIKITLVPSKIPRTSRNSWVSIKSCWPKLWTKCFWAWGVHENFFWGLGFLLYHQTPILCVFFIEFLTCQIVKKTETHQATRKNMQEKWRHNYIRNWKTDATEWIQITNNPPKKKQQYKTLYTTSTTPKRKKKLHHIHIQQVNDTPPKKNNKKNTLNHYKNDKLQIFPFQTKLLPTRWSPWSPWSLASLLVAPGEFRRWWQPEIR